MSSGRSFPSLKLEEGPKPRCRVSVLFRFCCGCKEGREDRKPGPSAGVGAEESRPPQARLWEDWPEGAGSSDSSLPGEVLGTVGPHARRSVTLPTAGGKLASGQGARTLLTSWAQGRTLRWSLWPDNKGLHTGCESLSGGTRDICFNCFKHFQATISCL